LDALHTGEKCPSERVDVERNGTVEFEADLELNEPYLDSYRIYNSHTLHARGIILVFSYIMRNKSVTNVSL